MNEEIQNERNMILQQRLQQVLYFKRENSNTKKGKIIQRSLVSFQNGKHKITQLNKIYFSR